MTDGRVEEVVYTFGWTDSFTDGCTDGFTDGCTDGCTDVDELSEKQLLLVNQRHILFGGRKPSKLLILVNLQKSGRHTKEPRTLS